MNVLGPLLLNIPKELLDQFQNEKPPYFERTHETNLKNNLKEEKEDGKDIEKKGKTSPSSSDSPHSSNKASENWKDLPCHKDEEQVSKDTERAFTYYPFKSSEEKEKLSGPIEKELYSLIVAVLRRNPQLSYYQGYHDIATIVYLIFGAQEAIPVLEYISLNFLRDFMMPLIEPSFDHLNMVSNLLEASDPELSEVISQANPFYAISPIITILTHDVVSFDNICLFLDLIFSTLNMATPIYLYTSIVKCQRDKLIPYKNDPTNMVDSLLSNIVETMPTEESFIFDVTSSASSLLQEHPPQTLRSWDLLSDYSVLKTSAAPPKISEPHFSNHPSYGSSQEHLEFENKNGLFSFDNDNDNSQSTHDNFDDFKTDSHEYEDDFEQLVLQFPTSPTFPAEKPFQLNLNTNSGSSSRHDSISSINKIQLLSQETLPTPDERAYEYLQNCDYTSDLFSQIHDIQNSTVLASKIDSSETKCYRSIPASTFDNKNNDYKSNSAIITSINSPNSTAFSPIQIGLGDGDDGTDSRATTAFGSFTSANGAVEEYSKSSLDKHPNNFGFDCNYGNDKKQDELNSYTKEHERDPKEKLDFVVAEDDVDDTETTDNDDVSVTEDSEKPFVFSSEIEQSLGSKPKDTINESVPYINQDNEQEVVAATGDVEEKEIKYTLDQLKEILSKQVEECKEQERIKNEELRRKREESAARNAAAATIAATAAAAKQNYSGEDQDGTSSRTSSSSSLLSNPQSIAGNVYNIFTFPTSLILNQLLNPSVTGTLPYHLSNAFPSIFNENSSLVGRLFQVSNGDSGNSSSVSSPGSSSPKSSTSSTTSDEAVNSSDNINKKILNRHDSSVTNRNSNYSAYKRINILSLLYPNSIASISLYAGVIGIVMAWYLNRNDVLGLKTFLGSQLRLYSNWFDNRGFPQIPFSMKSFWNFTTARRF